ncbi:MAG: hypothetical protein C0601_01195 [Candidatus Muiribacterium halophilum]|uniref:EamA domain-containing protein n=1 Tax=Muiribacterium halophilum TaxID=2053465 RepID=A0A2N5ZM29_MUIH1|nr:MAG: hypothetical protein C0601_01195 [Candidatus Muirbacterium halophilum]
MILLYFLLFVRLTINSFNFIIVKYLSPELNPLHINTLRAIFTFLLIFIFFRKRLVFKKEAIKTSMLLGILSVGLNQTLFVLGGTMTVSPHMAVIYSSIPIIIYMFSIFYKLEKALISRIIGIFAGFSGIVLIISEKGLNFDNELFKGDLVILCGAFAWSFYTIYTKKQKFFKNSTTLTLNTLFMGGLLYSVFGVPFFVFSYDPIIFKMSNMLIIFYFASITSILSYIIWNFVINGMDASLASLVQSGQVIMTTLLSIVIFDYEPGIRFYIGASVALIAIVLTQIKAVNGKHFVKGKV